MNRNLLKSEEILHQFITTNCILDDEKILQTRLLFCHYEKFCREKHIHNAMTEKQFVNLLKTHYALVPRRVMLKGEQRRCLIGITVAPQYRDESIDI